TASSATIALSPPATYIVRSTISGFCVKLRWPTGNVHASSSCATFFLLIWSSAEYCDELAEPPYARHVVYGFCACAAPPRNMDIAAMQNASVRGSRVIE